MANLNQSSISKGSNSEAGMTVARRITMDMGYAAGTNQAGQHMQVGFNIAPEAAHWVLTPTAELTSFNLDATRSTALAPERRDHYLVGLRAGFKPGIFALYGDVVGGALSTETPQLSSTTRFDWGAGIGANACFYEGLCVFAKVREMAPFSSHADTQWMTGLAIDSSRFGG